MTAPFDLGTARRLGTVAGWDVPRIRGAVASLAVADSALPPWRLRLETLGREVGGARGWAGPAAVSAVAELFELAGVAAALAAALEASLGHLESSVGHAAAAQDAAAAALAASHGDPMASAELVRQHAQVDRAVAALVPEAAPAVVSAAAGAAVQALDHAAAAERTLRAAEHALALLPAETPGPEGVFGALVGTLLPSEEVCLGPVPPRMPPAAAAAWFAGLSPQLQLTAIAASPAAIGALDGVPGWARDRANRQLLAATLADPTTSPETAATARILAARIAVEEAAGQPVQLQLLDLAGDRVALALGDLDTADAVVVLVPGIENTPSDDLGRLTASARAVAGAAGAAAPQISVATLVWLGYRTPTPVTSVVRAAAFRGGPALAGAVEGLAVARAANGAPPSRTTVLAHSYGTVVVDEAADAPGELAADAVVLLGSPGMEAVAAGLEVPEVYAAAAGEDPIAGIGWFGVRPDHPWYGATVLPADPHGGHSDYYDPAGPTLPALGEVVVGTRVPG